MLATVCPSSPKPHTTTRLSCNAPSGMGSVSPGVGSGAVASANLEPRDASAGVSPMDSTTTMMSSRLSSSGRMRSSLARLSSTKANSPPWLRRNPVLMASPLERPNSWEMEPMMPILTARRPPSRAMAIGHCWYSSWRSMEEPVVVKNSPSSSDLKGRMSASTCDLKFVSLRSTPAAKAPAVSLKPRRWVSREAPVTVSKHKATNVSSLRDSATTLNTRRSTVRPVSSSKPRDPTVCRAVGPSCDSRSMAPVDVMSLFSTSGSSTRNGTTAMSCISRIPRVALPNLEFVSPRSARSCSTNADDDRLSATPITTASSTERMLASCEEAWNTFSRICVPIPLPTGRANKVKAAVQQNICRRPRPKAYFARALSLSRESSKPISKSRNRTPSSLSFSISEMLRKSPS
mmetsp:Transcript_19073/g.57636  ORF Transcript_19073/g.57636 Transcript_19073/m.57636 type:complete len:404 (-) Transcript_19073:703-1914(-)